MFGLAGSKTRKCVETDQSVSIDQTEAQCRAIHRCEQAGCPLRAEFMSQRLEEFLICGKLA